MAKTMSITRNENDDDDASSSSRKRFKAIDNDGVASWSVVNHDVLLLVMMQLRIVDFLAFTGVCKSWRSFALSNRNTFMASKPPMKIRIKPRANSQDCYCCLEDFEGKLFKTIIPHSAGRKCVGLTCGYLIFFERESCDFLLVNPITRHELHFPDHRSYVGACREIFRGILVFLPSVSRWVFVMQYKRISFCVAGEQRWNHVSSTLPIVDFHVFKGKIYTLHTDSSLGELKFNLKRKRKWTLNVINNFSNPPELFNPLLVSLDENLYVIDGFSIPRKFMELDFGKMEWVSPKKTLGEYAYFFSYFNCFAAITPESWAGPWTKPKSSDTDKSQLCMFAYEGMWYFLSDCLNVTRLDE